MFVSVTPAVGPAPRLVNMRDVQFIRPNEDYQSCWLRMRDGEMLHIQESLSVLYALLQKHKLILTL